LEIIYRKRFFFYIAEGTSPTRVYFEETKKKKFLKIMFSKSSSKTNIIRHFIKTPITNTQKNTGNGGSKIILVVVEELDMVTW
jgi:hypothetical protein